MTKEMTWREWYDQYYRLVWLVMVTLVAWVVLIICSPFKEEYTELYVIFGTIFGTIAVIGSTLLALVGLHASSGFDDDW